MADIFISYAKEDRDRIEPLAKSLAEQGWSVWWDWQIPAGQTWREVIGEALEGARAVVVAWSETSVKSRWVQEEADRGLERTILLPVFLDDVRPPLGFGAVQAVDLSQWKPAESSPQFDKLIADLALILGPSPQKANIEAQKQGDKDAVAEAKQREAARERVAEERHRRQAKEEQQRKAAENPMLGDCTTYTAMSGSGVRIGMENTRPVRRPIPQGQPKAPNTSHAAAPGAAPPFTAGQLSAAVWIPTAGAVMSGSG